MTTVPITHGPGLGDWQTTGRLILARDGNLRVVYRHPTEGERRDWFDGTTGKRLHDVFDGPRVDLPECAMRGMMG